MTAKAKRALFSAILALAATGAHGQDAGDTVMGLKSGGLALLQRLEITTQSEKLAISPEKIQADYVYRNDSDHPVSTFFVIGLPELKGPAMNVDSGDNGQDNFLRYRIVVDDKTIEPVLQRRVYSGAIDMTDVVTAAKVPLNPFADATRQALSALSPEVQADWLSRGLIVENTYDGPVDGKPVYMAAWAMRSSFSWPAQFAPGQVVRVSVSHVPSIGSTVAIPFLEDGEAKGAAFLADKATYCLSDELVAAARASLKDESGAHGYYVHTMSYTLTDDTSWATAVKAFTLSVDKGEASHHISFCGQDLKQTGPTTQEMTASDFVAEKDLEILMLVPSQAP